MMRAKLHSLWPMLLMLAIAIPVLAETPSLQHAGDLYDARRWRDAIPVYEQLIPTLEGEAKIDAQYRLAYCMLRTYRGDRAIQAYKDLIDMPGVSPGYTGVAHYQIGYLHALRGEHEAALDWYLHVPEIEGAEPDHVCTAWLFAARAHYKLEQWDEAIEAYENAVAVEDAHFVTRQTAQVGIASRYQEIGEYEKALAAYERVLELGEGGRYAHIARNRIMECRSALSGSDAFYLEPYVTSVGATTAHVVWVSRRDAPAGTLEVVAEGAGAADAEPIVREALRLDFQDRPAFRQGVRLADLEPNTRYRYTAICGDERVAGSFVTAPPSGDEVRFAVIGDTQGGHAVHGEVAAHIAEFEPAFVVHVGDCVERGQRWDEWKVQMFDPGRPYLEQGAIYPARGNHDGGPYFRGLFGRDEHIFDDFRFGDVHLFVMDSQSSTGGSRRDAQLQWLEQGLASTDARWTVVALHHPMIHSPATEPLFGVDDFLPLLTRHEVDLVLTGHYHVYQRLLPIGLDGQKPVIHITSGGGGGIMGSRTISPLVVTDSMQHHHVRFTVESDRLEMVALLRDGTELDRMTLSKNDLGHYQDDVMARTVPLTLAQQARLFYHHMTHPHSRRDDYTATVLGEPEPGEPITLRLDRQLLDDDDIPGEAVLLLRPIAGEPWQFEPTTLDIRRDHWTFSATAPQDVTLQGGRVQPAMRMEVLLRVGEFDFEAEAVDVTVSAVSMANPE